MDAQTSAVHSACSCFAIDLHTPARTTGTKARKRERVRCFAACRLAGLSALEAHYAGVDAHAQMLGRLTAMRGPGATYSDVILRLVELEAALLPALPADPIGLRGFRAPSLRNGSAPILIKYAHPNSVRRPRYASPTQERGPGASGVSLHFTKDVVQAVEKLHPVFHCRLVERRKWAAPLGEGVAHFLYLAVEARRIRRAP
jgi:hypothetical protein